MRQRGYTLIEVTLALAITALVMTALAGSLTTSLHARAAATATLDRAATARTVLLHLERELATALPEGFGVTAAPPALRFTGGTEPGERLSYVVEDGALVRRAEPRFGVADAPPGPATPLIGGVTTFDVRVLDGTAWKAVWSGREPPRAARIDLGLDDGETLSMVVPIPTGRGGATS